MPGHTPPDAAAARRDRIVIGASAGGIGPLQTILGDLPPDFAAAIFIVLHVGATSHLAEVLSLRSAVPVIPARSGMTIEAGRAYVAVPGCHLLVHDGHLLLRRGPRENMARPAIDPLFRSAALSWGGRTIGVVLSGALNDGSSGLRAIKRCGGIAVVQDPAEAAVASMPVSALRVAKADHVAASDAIGDLLARLSTETAGPTPPIPLDIRLETAIAAQELAGMDANDDLGSISRFTCPECHGALWEIGDGTMLRFRCHVGHAYTAETALEAQTQGAEEMLWSLMRSHQERAELARRMAEYEHRSDRAQTAALFSERARDYDQSAALVASMLRELVPAPTGEGEGTGG